MAFKTKNGPKNIRTVISCGGVTKFVKGEYHPNVETIYLRQSDLEKSPARFGFNPSDTFVEDCIAKVKVCCRDGLNRLWERGNSLDKTLDKKTDF